MRYLSRSRMLLTSSSNHFKAQQLHSKSQSINTLLKAYIQSNSTKKALLLFQSIHNKRASSVDSFTIHFVLKACTMRSSLVEAKQIHTLIFNLGFQPVISLQTTLINLYSSVGTLEDAHRVFDEVCFRNVICWTALVSAYIDNGRPGVALKLFREMQMEKVEPDRVTVTVALSACVDLGSLEMGEWIHAYVRRKRGFEGDLCLSNALVNMYVKCGDIGAARRLFDGFDRRDVTTWTSMIVGHALHGEAKQALKLFAEMESKIDFVRDNNNGGGEVVPNEVTFVGVLMACSHAGMVEEGWRHFRSMRKKYGLKPQISHYGCMVDLLCRAGLLKEAHAFITNMPTQPNAVVWRTLLGACSIQGYIELGERVRHKLLELDPTYAGDDVTMSNTYASASMWDEKATVRAQIKLRRSPGCSLIELGDGVHRFVAADKEHPLVTETCEVLEALINNMRGYNHVQDISYMDFRMN